MKAEDVASLAKMFGVNFTQGDINTLQSWINEEKKKKKVRRNKIMGITCKPVGKQKSMMQKMQNELDKQKKAMKVKKNGGKK